MCAPRKRSVKNKSRNHLTVIFEVLILVKGIISIMITYIYCLSITHSAHAYRCPFTANFQALHRVGQMLPTNHENTNRWQHVVKSDNE